MNKKKWITILSAAILTLSCSVQAVSADAFGTLTAAIASPESSRTLTAVNTSPESSRTLTADITEPESSQILTAAVASQNAAASETRLYRWEKVESNDRFPTDGSCHLLIIYKDNTYVTVDDMKLKVLPSEAAYADFAGNRTHFVTVGDLNTPAAHFSGSYDSDNHNAPIIRLDLPDDVANKYPVLVNTPFTFDTRYIYPSYDDPYIKTEIFHNISGGYDCALAVISESKKSKVKRLMYSKDYRGTDKEEEKFTVYIGEEIPVNCLSTAQKQYVVDAGQTWNLTDQTYIPDGVTIRVCDGGTLSISGQCYNQGAIRLEKGACMILEQGATLGYMTLMNQESSGSEFLTSIDADIVILDEAKLIGDNSRSINLLSGRMLNYGLFVMGSNGEIGSTYFFDNQASDESDGIYLFYMIMEQVIQYPTDLGTLNAQYIKGRLFPCSFLMFFNDEKLSELRNTYIKESQGGYYLRDPNNTMHSYEIKSLTSSASIDPGKIFKKVE